MSWPFPRGSSEEPLPTASFARPVQTHSQRNYARPAATSPSMDVEMEDSPMPSLPTVFLPKAPRTSSPPNSRSHENLAEELSKHIDRMSITEAAELEAEAERAALSVARNRILELADPSLLAASSSSGTRPSRCPDNESTAVPAPGTHQQQQLSRPEPSPDNPFYHPTLTLALAAQNIHAYFHESTLWLTHWRATTPTSTLVEIARKPSSTLSRIFTHISWTLEFLRLRRKGWSLLRFPDEFFADVLPLVEGTLAELERLGEWKGCEVMMGKAWREANEVRGRLGDIRRERVEEGKRVWADSLEAKKGDVSSEMEV